MHRLRIKSRRARATKSCQAGAGRVRRRQGSAGRPVERAGRAACQGLIVLPLRKTKDTNRLVTVERTGFGWAVR